MREALAKALARANLPKAVGAVLSDVPHDAELRLRVLDEIPETSDPRSYVSAAQINPASYGFRAAPPR